ncbi:MAG: hypothetical protein NTV49_03260 [Kiritimatiellaeota bacterium]|nr:hypothetical protein [Kiritimatiellota bacterium]
MMEYWTYRLAALLSRRLPRLFVYWLGLRLADFFYLFRRHDRQAVIRNLRRIYTAQGITLAAPALEGLARKTFQYFGKYLVDFFRFARLTPAQVHHLVSLEHTDYLAAAQQHGRGVLLVTAHVGNWELGGAVIAALGYRVNAVVLPERVEKINRLFQRQREQRGINPIPLGQSPLALVRCLRRGEMVALLGDRDFTRHGVPAPFFGQPVSLPRGPARLAFKTGAPILPAFLLRQVDDTFLLRCHPPIYPGQEGSVARIQEKLIAVMEKEIAAAPYQWFIFEDFWPPARL